MRLYLRETRIMEISTAAIFTKFMKASVRDKELFSAFPQDFHEIYDILSLFLYEIYEFSLFFSRTITSAKFAINDLISIC